MNHRPLGSSGLVVSVVGLGCNAFGRRIDAMLLVVPVVIVNQHPM